MFSYAILPLLLAARSAGAQDERTPEVGATLGPLGVDDECQAGSVEGCGLNAMQLRRQRMSEAPLDDPEEVKPVKPQGPYQQCGGNHYTGVTECTDGFKCFNVSEHFSLCKPTAQVDIPWKAYTGSSLLKEKSKAPMLTFYMYRAIDTGDYPPTNANLASIGGMLWFLHTQVVSCQICPKVRLHDIDRIVRYKVQVRATQPLFMAGMNFGPTVQFQLGQCSGPGDCDELFAQYGYYIGCHNISSDPQNPVYYNGAMYSLPGECPGLTREDKSMECKSGQPGGECEGTPTGTGTCTWTFEDAGEIGLNELEGITSYTAFKQMGGVEYNPASDMGTNMTFWDNINSTEANAARVKKLDDMFKKEYPELPSEKELGLPPCDFSNEKFLKGSQ